MSKKVLIISSSPVKEGNSDTLANEFARGAESSGNSVEKVSLRDKKSKNQFQKRTNLTDKYTNLADLRIIDD